MAIRVVPYNPGWQADFNAEAGRITQALKEVVVKLDHIGSTAIPSSAAKPIIDILMEVVALPAIDARTPTMEGLGYEAMGEYGIPGRRYFRRNDSSGNRTHHVHAFQTGSAEIVRHLAFRDYMIAHPEIAHQYGRLKQRLAEQYPNDMNAYMGGKDDFVKQHQARALLWRQSNNQPAA